MTPDLIARYAEARLPRYTSYPTAPHFTPAVDAETYAGWLDALPEDVELSLYLHVPFCAELCLYCGCHTTVARRYAPVAAYVELLEREIDIVAARLRSGARVSYLHWGGGTPTILSAEDWRRLGRRLGDRFRFEPEAEIAVEIDPRTLCVERVEALAETGVNRASLGVQSFEPAVQQAIGRIQSPEQTRRAAEALRRAGIAQLSLDLMYGLPHQTVGNLRDTIDEALAVEPDRISLFGYAHVPWMKRHQALLPEAALPRPIERVAQAEAAAERIVGAGYARIGLDHFALSEDPIARALDSGALRRNFQGYTTDRAPALIAFGASAISRLPQGYAQNAPGVPAYRTAVKAGQPATARGIALTAEDRLRAEVIERLMCDLAVDLDEVCARHGVAATHFAAEFARIDALQDEGLARRSGARIEVEPEARDLVRAVGAVFDARLAPAAAIGRHASAL
jgi:oxygen-independent coproporphyrinogen-3 oxidase